MTGCEVFYPARIRSSHRYLQFGKTFHNIVQQVVPSRPRLPHVSASARTFLREAITVTRAQAPKVKTRPSEKRYLYASALVLVGTLTLMLIHRPVKILQNILHNYKPSSSPLTETHLYPDRDARTPPSSYSYCITVCTVLSLAAPLPSCTLVSLCKKVQSFQVGQ